MRIRQCVLDGEVQSHRNLQCLMQAACFGKLRLLNFSLIEIYSVLWGQAKGDSVTVSV